MDPVRELVQRRLDELADAEGTRPSVREAARRCGMPDSTFQYHFGRQQKRKRQELTDEQLAAVAAGLGIALRDLQAATIVAAGYVVDIRRFGLDVIESVLPAGMSAEERREQQLEARRLTQEHARPQHC